jgi:endonuclease G, mitochondrial
MLRAKHFSMLLFAGCLLSACRSAKVPGDAGSIHLVLGNPSNAEASPTHPENYLIARPQYALSYNRDRGIPNWVSWQLNAVWLGDLPRLPFSPDNSLPGSWYRATPNDYTGSGYDRGHMTPAADRNRTPEDSQAVFLMTNILPQAPDNNQGPWERLESYCRKLALQGKELEIIAGGYGTQTTLANGKIAAPTHTWKVIVVLDRPGTGVDGVSNSTRVIAIDMPNLNGIKRTRWQKYRVSVDQIEAATGYDLLSNVPEAIQKKLESQVDGQ